MIKETFTDTLGKHFYGITAPFDEQKRQEANKLGNLAFILISWFLLLGNALALILADKHPKIVAWAYPIIIQIVLLALFFYITWKSHRNHLTDIETELQSPKEQIKMPRIALKIFSYSAIIFYVLMFIFNYFTNGASTIFTPHHQLQLFTSSIVYALLITISSLFIIQFRIKHATKEEK